MQANPARKQVSPAQGGRPFTHTGGETTPYEQADLARLWERDELAHIDAEINEPRYDGEPLQMQDIIDALVTAADDRPN